MVHAWQACTLCTHVLRSLEIVWKKSAISKSRYHSRDSTHFCNLEILQRNLRSRKSLKCVERIHTFVGNDCNTEVVYGHMAVPWPHNEMVTMEIELDDRRSKFEGGEQLRVVEVGVEWVEPNLQEQRHIIRNKQYCTVQFKGKVTRANEWPMS